MMNLNIKKIFVVAAILVCSGCGSAVRERNDLSSLLDDMKHYRTTSVHRGDLWQHSIWTAQTLGRWVYGKKQDSDQMIASLVRPLSQRECYLLEVAGVVHDIGKAGDLKLEKYVKTTRDGDTIHYFSRENHERIGFEFIAHDLPSMNGKFTRSYQAVDGRHINFYLLLSKLGVTEEEQKLIAILVGAHKSLYLSSFQPSDKSADFVIGQINDLAKEISYDLRNMKSLLCMSFLLQVADVTAAYFPVISKVPSSLFAADYIVPSPHPHHEDDMAAAQMLAHFMPRTEKLVSTILARYESSFAN